MLVKLQQGLMNKQLEKFARATLKEDLMWVSTKEALDKLKITRKTLNVWKHSGKIEVKQPSTRKFLYNVDSVANFSPVIDRKNVVYARVSNTKQKDDLARQINFIKEYMIVHGIKPDIVFSEIASGMNE